MKKRFVCILTRIEGTGKSIMIVTEKKKTARFTMTKMAFDDMEYDKMTTTTFEKDRIILEKDSKKIEYQIEEEEVR